MSGTATRWAWKMADTENNITSSGVLVLTALAHFHNQETGRCNPSIARIAQRTKLGRSTIKRAIRELSDAGLLKVIYQKDRYKGAVKNHPNTYILASGGRSMVNRGVGPQRTPKETDKSARALPSSVYDLANIIDEGD